MLSPFVRVPDIEEDLSLSTQKTLTTVSDKQHCTLAQVQANECQIVDKEVIDKHGQWIKNKATGEHEWDGGPFTRIELNTGFVALVRMANGDIAAFMESKIGFEPGVRVYKLWPGDCTKLCPPYVKDFWGFYFPDGDNDAVPMVAAVAAIPRNERRVVVLERNGFPIGNEFPLPQMPLDKLCIVDIGYRNDDGVFTNKVCVLNLLRIDDPYDVDQNGRIVYAQAQLKNEGLLVLDDYCIMIGTDTSTCIGACLLTLGGPISLLLRRVFF